MTEQRPSRILVVEDDEAHGEALRLALETDGHQVEGAKDAESALDRLRAREFDLVVSDLVLGRQDGLSLLREARRLDPELSVFLITGHGSVETAVAAMREGAADFLAKPVNIVELRTRVGRELEKRRLSEDNRRLRAQLDQRFGLEGLIGNSPAMQEVFETIRQAGPTDATVLLLGESGTGKEMVAQALHRLSPRSKKRFVAINCAALTETLIESELFGHVKGAYTGAQTAKEGKFEFAKGGTLFLDEIGDMPLSTQTKLLRVLEQRKVTPVGANEEREVDVRIIAATNRDLEARVREGRFREDLFYRLAVITVDLPPLRNRLQDLPLLVHHFQEEFSNKHRKEIHAIQPEVMDSFRHHVWPGNVRELRNVVETMVVLDRNGELGREDLPRHLLRREALPAAVPIDPEESASGIGMDAAPKEVAEAGGEAGGGQVEAWLVGKTLAEVEEELIRATLVKLEGNRAKAAKALGMGERTLYRKIKEFGL
ncbi:MAG: sigma-54-dependent Fis family transcriptional regulator [Planctomycetota bacterium]|nr:MAG: sigma-54-dependent Fis family transcriptional regulator [Planctomycetota bacterium]